MQQLFVAMRDLLHALSRMQADRDTEAYIRHRAWRGARRARSFSIFNSVWVRVLSRHFWNCKAWRIRERRGN